MHGNCLKSSLLHTGGIVRTSKEDQQDLKNTTTAGYHGFSVKFYLMYADDNNHASPCNVRC